MKFQPTAGRGAIRIAFVTGSLGRFDGKVLSVPFGETKPLSRRKFVLLMRKVVATAKQNHLKSLVIDYKDIRALAPKSMGDYEVGRIAGTAFVMADYEHVVYKTKPKEGWNFVEMMGITNTPEVGKEGFWHGSIIGEEVNACRELSNTPGGDMTPKILAAAAKKALKGTRAKVKVLGVKEMQKLGMGAVLGVGKGAKDEPQFIIVEYKGGGKAPPVVLIGKGVTFDTGGIQVKPGEHMYEMHMDMSGGAAVIHTLALAAKLKIKTNVVGLIPAVENAVGAGAVRPGDMLKSLSGRTIEILHTDAEGRVILADAITYAKRYNPAIVADAATLTGAALTALGLQASAYMTNREDMIDAVQGLGEESGDYVWPLPLWEEYDDMVKGHFGDVPNISTSGNSRNGGVIAGGKFLEVFAKDLDCPWLHFDIAPRMTSAPGEHLARGAAGAPVRLFLALIEKYAHPDKN
ncbi:leucyl aminopeptidase family protein [Candidatus Kaiserbacteria bacterium]|nr:leucyl aminopeptidase family protein [Candidatus Kaiserbacteria bacterium]